MQRRRSAPRPEAAGDAFDAVLRGRAPAAIAWLPLAGLVALGAVYLLSRPSYYRLLQEDHVVEWTQFWLCASAALIAVAATRELATARRATPALATAVFAVGMLLLAGEEISWAQRALGFGTPPDLAVVNEQAEFNIHNVGTGGISALFKLASFLLGAVGTIWIFVARRRPARPDDLLGLLRPPLSALPGFTAMAVYQPLIRLSPVAINPLSRLQEWVEVCLFVALTATITVVFLRVSRHGVQRPAARRTLLLVLVGVAGLTVVLAALTAYHGIVPGNVQPLES